MSKFCIKNLLSLFQMIRHFDFLDTHILRCTLYIYRVKVMYLEKTKMSYTLEWREYLWLTKSHKFGRY